MTLDYQDEWMGCAVKTGMAAATGRVKATGLECAGFVWWCRCLCL